MRGTRRCISFLRRANYPDKVPEKAPLNMRDIVIGLAPCCRGNDNDSQKLLMPACDAKLLKASAMNLRNLVSRRSVRTAWRNYPHETDLTR